MTLRSRLRCPWLELVALIILLFGPPGHSATAEDDPCQGLPCVWGTFDDGSSSGPPPLDPVGDIPYPGYPGMPPASPSTPSGNAPLSNSQPSGAPPPLPQYPAIANSQKHSLTSLAFDGIHMSGNVSGSGVTPVYDSHNVLLGVLPAQAIVPMPQGEHPAGTPPTMSGTEPVAADGEFVVDETDVVLPGVGVPFTFTRHYRSGMNFQSQLGFGWNHNFGMRLVYATTSYESKTSCNSPKHDVFLVTERMDRVRFAWTGVSNDDRFDIYTARQEGSPFHLRRDAQGEEAPWILEDGGGLVYRFEAHWGTLASIEDYAGHALSLRWDHEDQNWIPTGGKLVSVTDTTGRVIKFVYGSVSASAMLPKRGMYASNVAHGDVETLRCLSVGVNNQNSVEHDPCAKPLVSFTQHAAIAQVMWVSAAEKVRQQQGLPDWAKLTDEYEPVVKSIEFDLVAVTDAAKRTTTYSYRNGSDELVTREFSDFLPSAHTPQVCEAYCGPNDVTKGQDCHNLDACVAALIGAEAECDSIGTTSNALDAWCLWFWSTDGQYEDYYRYKDRGSYCLSLTSAMFCTYPGPEHPCPGRDETELKRWVDSCKSRVSWNLGGEYNLIQCQTACFAQCSDQKTMGRYAYGVPPDLLHNLESIIDAEGRTVVKNEYGVDPFAPDFDRVKTHLQGDATASDHEMKFEYHPLRLEREGRAPPSLLTTRPFVSRDLCSEEVGTPPVTQVPEYAVVVYDINDVAHIRYYDAAWRLLRDIASSGATIDYNYDQGFLRGVQATSGARICLQNDADGKPTRVTHLPAPGYPGQQDPIVTELAYDAREQLVQVVEDPDGPEPTGIRYVRDQYERIVAEGRQTGPTTAAWTCYAYADPTDFRQVRETIGRPLRGLLGGRNTSPRIHEPPPPFLGETRPARARSGEMFQPSGCVVNSLSILGNKSGVRRRSFPRRRDAIPSTITRPDWSELQLSGLTAGGASEIKLIDVDGTTQLIHRYARFDDFGWPAEVGALVDGTPRSATARLTTFGATTGLLESVTEAGVTTTLDYDSHQNLQSTTTPTYTRQSRLDALGHTVSIIDAPIADYVPITEERRTCFNYDIHGRLHDVVLPEGNAEHYDYDSDGRLLAFARGDPTKFGAWAEDCGAVPTLHLGGGPLMETLAAFEYDMHGMPSTVTRNGVRQGIVVDGFGRVIDTYQFDRKKFAAKKWLSIYTHHPRGLDAHGRVQWEAVADGDTGPIDYAKPLAPTSGLHAMTEYQYDRIGRITRIDRWRFREDPIAADSARPRAVTRRVYDDAQATLTTTGENGSVTVESFDGVGRTRHLTVAAGGADAMDVEYAWALNGDSVTTTTSPMPTTTGTFTRKLDFDALGRVAAVTEADRTVLSVGRDSLDRPNQLTTPQQGTVTYDFDAYGRVVATHASAAPAQPIDTATMWSANGHVVGLQDGAGHKTQYDFDKVDRLRQETNGLGATTIAYVRGTDRPFRVSDAARTISLYSYDQAGRTTSIVTGDGPTLGPPRRKWTRRFWYTPLGQLRSATLQGGATVSMTYNSLGEKLSESNDAVPISLAFGYAADGRQTRLRNGSATLQTITRIDDALGRPKAVALGAKKLALYGYKGLLSDVTYINGVRSSVTYDDRLRVLGVDVNGNSSKLAGIDQLRGQDDVPRKRQLTVGTEWVRTDLFKVDKLGRVTAENRMLSGVPVTVAAGPADDVDENEVNLSWNPLEIWSTVDLDAADNWTARHGAGSFVPEIDSANRYNAIDGKTLPYDAGGRLLAYKNETYHWNGLGWLTSATIYGLQTSYDFDALGRRFRERTASGSTFLVWDDNTIVAIGDDADFTATRVRIGAGSDDTVAMADHLGVGPVYYLHAGPDGSTIAATNESGALIEGYTYSAFGETSYIGFDGKVVGGSKIDNRFLFQGQLYDAPHRLYAMRAREYRPAWGRFLSPDPAGTLAGGNLYAFVSGRPLTFKDPSGLCSQDIQAPSETTPRVPQLGDFEKGVVNGITTFPLRLLENTIMLPLKISSPEGLRWFTHEFEPIVEKARIFKNTSEWSKAIEFVGGAYAGNFLGLLGEVNAIASGPRMGATAEAMESIAPTAEAVAEVAQPLAGQIAYGGSDLSQAVMEFRQAAGIYGGRNVAAFEYQTVEGTLETVIAPSERGFISAGRLQGEPIGHAEHVISAYLEQHGIDPSQVTRIYSELQPCVGCARYIERTFPQAQVTWSFEYGATVESRAAGVEALGNATNLLP